MLLRRQFVLASLFAAASDARAETDPWPAFRSGAAVVIMRHAMAPGTGDPANFRIGDCSTQRNLSEDGRAQARRIGDLFRANGTNAARVFSSQWCRCLDTASLLRLGAVREQPLLNSFFGKPEDGRAQTDSLRDWMTGLPTGVPVILVTHQVNITGLTNVFPSSGELVFVTADHTKPLSVVATLNL
jgi:phosphohistidine phosphatase SixA